MSLMEQMIGWIYLPVHSIGLHFFASFIVSLTGYDNSQYNLFCYTVGFVVLSLAMSSYLRNSLDVFLDNIWLSLRSVGTNLILYYVAQYAITLFLLMAISQTVNPNTETVDEAIQVNSKIMLFLAAVLAPFVEEILFRGVVFGNIAKKNRTAAYIISTVLFAAYHLWIYVLYGESILIILIYSVQYVPASVLFARTYEQSGNIYAPMLMHMIINIIAVNAASGI